MSLISILSLSALENLITNGDFSSKDAKGLLGWKFWSHEGAKSIFEENSFSQKKENEITFLRIFVSDKAEGKETRLVAGSELTRLSSLEKKLFWSVNLRQRLSTKVKPDARGTQVSIAFLNSEKQYIEPRTSQNLSKEDLSEWKTFKGSSEVPSGSTFVVIHLSMDQYGEFDFTQVMTSSEETPAS